jgi:chorismate mutase/prephenate dehydratase
MSTDSHLAKGTADSAIESATDELEALRREINDLDGRILDFLNQRARIALEIALRKRIIGLPVYSPEREDQVLDLICKANPGPLSAGDLRRIYGEIISACREVQSPLKVAFLGPDYTFSHQAALSRFGGGADLSGQATIADVFTAVQRGQCQVGLVPVENSTEGGVGATLDCFITSELKVCGEVFAPVSHTLMSREQGLESIKRVYSHPQGLNQCRSWLARYMPDAVLIETESTSAAARRAMDESESAAVGPEMAARHYGMEILASDIQDTSPNLTRFLVLGHESCPATGDDKTSMVFLASHRPGSLYDALRHFASRGLNLCRIESRPTKDRPWEYAFFVDVMGHQDDDPVREALTALEQDLDLLKVLGSYPSGTNGLPESISCGRR